VGHERKEEGRGRPLPTDRFAGRDREGLGHRFAAAWVRVRAAFGDGRCVCAPREIILISLFSSLRETIHCRVFPPTVGGRRSCVYLRDDPPDGIDR